MNQGGVVKPDVPQGCKGSCHLTASMDRIDVVTMGPCQISTDELEVETTPPPRQDLPKNQEADLRRRLSP